MQDDLEEREREFKRARMDTVKEQREREDKEAYIRDQGRRMREEREKAVLAKDQATQRIPESKPPATGSEEIGEHIRVSLRQSVVRLVTDRPCKDSADLAVRVKFTTTLRPDLSTPTALVALLRPFGALDEDSVLLSIKPPKKHPTKPPKFATAVVTFQKIQGAFGAVGASGQTARGLENVDIAWAKGVEPEVVRRLRSQGDSLHSLNGASVSQAGSEVSRRPYYKGPSHGFLYAGRSHSSFYCTRTAAGRPFVRRARDADAATTAPGRERKIGTPEEESGAKSYSTLKPRQFTSGGEMCLGIPPVALDALSGRTCSTDVIT